MKRTMRFWPALWAGKIISLVLKILKRKGTTLPGVVANRIDPQIIKHLSSSYTEGIMIVTGTNGKTTTANLIANILKAAGKSFAFNQAGANLVTGIAGALLQNAGWTGKAAAKLALLEVDEATVPKFCEQVAPKMAIITNFFRDQLDRYGELDTTVNLVKNSLPDHTLLVLNADDPLVAQFGLGRAEALYYGISETPESKKESRETREARFCPLCGHTLDYALFHYGQLGLYQCESCHYQRPAPDVLAEQVHTEEGNVLFRAGITSYSIALQGYYNLYNALAAITACRQIGISSREIDLGLREFVPQAGRMERFNFSEGQVTLTLVKNPTGFNQVLHTFLSGSSKISLLIAINDLAADGRDISWLWDVDFEQLGEQEARIRRVVCTGLRAEEMALRLKYAGLAVDKLIIEHSFEDSVALLLTERPQGEDAYIMPTYTALFPMREILERRSGDLESRKFQKEEASA